MHTTQSLQPLRWAGKRTSSLLSRWQALGKPTPRKPVKFESLPKILSKLMLFLGYQPEKLDKWIKLADLNQVQQYSVKKNSTSECQLIGEMENQTQQEGILVCQEKKIKFPYISPAHSQINTVPEERQASQDKVLSWSYSGPLTEVNHHRIWHGTILNSSFIPWIHSFFFYQKISIDQSS